MSKLHIKKNDTVFVNAGEDKGKTGKVLKVLVKEQRAIVEGVNFVSKNTKPSAKNPQGGIIKQEAPIHISNLAISKGHGYQGVVKRHGFGGVGQQTHGQHNRGRKPGSIGACSYPAKVFKGMRMAGHMGNERVTTQNLQVLKVIPEHNLLLIKGSIPGYKGSIVSILR